MSAIRPNQADPGPGIHGPLPPLRGSASLALLARVHLRQAWRRLASIRHQSKLLSALIGTFLASYAILAFALFRAGLRFVDSFPGLGNLLVERLIYLLFAFLFMLLLFSNLVISYTNLFRNRETQFLLSLPLPAQTVYQWKLIESCLLASWAFLFLVSPLLVAYGLHRHVDWHFYVAILCLLMLFILLPGVIGAWCAVQVARFLDRRAFQVLLTTGICLMIAGAFLWLKTEPITETELETRVMNVVDRLLTKTSFTQFPWLPSYWLSTGVVHWSEGAWRSSVFYGLVLLSHVLFFGYLAFGFTGRIFAEAVSITQSRGSAFWKWRWFRHWQERHRQVVHQPRGIERLMNRLPLLSSDVRALLIKDVRLFWRDTSQWGQTLVLFGLLCTYIVNLRHFSHQLTNPFWVQLVSYLNLGACSLNLATLTTRFVYPQFSLEGKRIWIVGMAPVGLAKVISTKYWLTSITSLGVTLGLTWLSCHMLGMPWFRTAYFILIITIMTLTLNGLAMGLGVLYPNFKEDNPSKIVSGFGGTFCLVLSFLYIVATVVILAYGSPWPWHTLPAPLPYHRFVPASLVFLTMSFLLGWLPFRLARQRVASEEIQAL